MAGELTNEGLHAWKGLLISHAALIETINREMTEAGHVTMDWYDVLLALEEAPNQKLKMSELADQVLLSKSGLTRLVDKMADAGLLERQRCKNDRRVAYAVLTKKGLGAREAGWPTYRQAIQEHFASHLTTDEARTIGEVLLRFTGRFRRRGSCGGQRS